MKLGSFPLLFLALASSFSHSSAQPDFKYNFCLGGNYTNTSIFATNLNTVLSTLPHIPNTTFYNLTSGVNSSVDQVNALALCRGDVPSSTCNSCISNAAQKIRQVCPTQKEAVGWYEYCMIRYSNRSIFSRMEERPEVAIYSTANASDPDTYAGTLGELLRELLDKAAAGDGRRKYAAGSTRVSDFVYVYGLVDCTPDLNEVDCGGCIAGAMGYIQSVCYGKRAAFIGRPSCVVQFADYQFYDSVNQSLSSSPSPATTVWNESTTTTATAGKGNKGDQLVTGKGNKAYKIVIAAVLPASISIVLVAILSWCFLRRKRWKIIESSSAVQEAKDGTQSGESLQFDLRRIRVATNNFSDANKLGRGGFGAVYKGVLFNGQQVAVKRLSKGSGQGGREFRTEVLFLTKLRHRNLVTLLGFCMEGEERLLIYDFVPNGSLDHILFDPIKGRVLDWQTRYKIITGIARGLLYLHEGSQLRIIHRDLKASNILLDEEMGPRISDFGTASLFQTDQTQGDTNRVVGTYGYMAPEYALHGLFSAKSDVYSFGVLVLEIISGRRSVGTFQGETSNDLISSVWRKWREGHPMDVIDKRISTRQRSEIIRCIHIGLLCVQENETDRPTMSSVVLMLSSRSVTLAVPSYPAYVTQTVVPLLRPSGRQGSEGATSHESKGNPQRSHTGGS